MDFFSFRYQLQDFIYAQDLVHNTPTIPTKRLVKIFGVFLAIIFIVFAGIFFFFNAVSFLNPFFSGWGVKEFVDYILGFKKATGSGWLLVLLVFPILFILLDLISKFRWWLMIRNNPDITLEERKITLTEQGLIFITLKSETNFKWDYFKNVIEGKELFILLKTKSNYLTIPKRAFLNSSDENTFREIIEKHIGPIQKRSW